MITSSTVFDIERFGGWAPSPSPPSTQNRMTTGFSSLRANSVDSVDQSSTGDSGCLPDKNGGHQFPRAPCATECMHMPRILFSSLESAVKGNREDRDVADGGCRFLRGAVCSTRDLDQTHERAKCSGTAQHHAR